MPEHPRRAALPAALETDSVRRSAPCVFNPLPLYHGHRRPDNSASNRCVQMLLPRLQNLRCRPPAFLVACFVLAHATNIEREIYNRERGDDSRFGAQDIFAQRSFQEPAVSRGLELPLGPSAFM